MRAITPVFLDAEPVQNLRGRKFCADRPKLDKSRNPLVPGIELEPTLLLARGQALGF